MECGVGVWVWLAGCCAGCFQFGFVRNGAVLISSSVFAVGLLFSSKLIG